MTAVAAHELLQTRVCARAGCPNEADGPDGLCRTCRVPSRKDRAELAAKLRATGATVNQIAERLGISRSYASALLLDPDGTADAARKRRYGGTCERCGGRTDGANGRRNAPRICIACFNAKRHDERYWTPSRIIAAIQRYAGEHGRPPGASEWLAGSHGRDVDGYPYTGIVQREFGTWSAAVRAAGFQSRTGHHHGETPEGHRITTEAYLDRIIAFREQHGRAPNGTELGSTYSALRNRGYRWTDALYLAGHRAAHTAPKNETAATDREAA